MNFEHILSLKYVLIKDLLKQYTEIFNFYTLSKYSKTII
jgi:hypothetical protein